MEKAKENCSVFKWDIFLKESISKKGTKDFILSF